VIGVGGLPVEVGDVVLERRVVFNFIAAVIEVDGDSHHIAFDDDKLLVEGLGVDSIMDIDGGELGGDRLGVEGEKFRGAGFSSTVVL
jgi:hypothetical protein